MMTAIFAALLIAALAPLAAFCSERFVEAGRRRRAYRRILREPLITVGTVLDRLEVEGRDKPLMRHCRIVSLSVGRMEVHSIGTHPVAMSFTGREFEKLHPVVCLKHPPRAKKKES